MSFISYAQNFEDVMLFRAFKEVRKGFYIDVGAQDPVVDSVTQAFYERGWRGINLEPVPAYFEKLAAARPEDINLMTAIGNRNGTIRFFDIAGSGLSIVLESFAQRHAQSGFQVSEREAPCVRLDAICDSHQVVEIHFLKVDVEGSERAVLEGFDFSRYRPWIVLLEATEPNSEVETYQDWEPLLVQQGYDFVYFDGLNRFYLAHEHQAMKRAFNSPPNYKDDFITSREHAARQECRASQQQAVSCGEQNQALLQQNQTLLLQNQTLLLQNQALLQQYQVLSLQYQALVQERLFLQGKVAALESERNALTDRLQGLRAGDSPR